jgi:hypothetical protein
MVGPPGPVCLILVGARRGEAELLDHRRLAMTRKAEARAQPPVIRQGRADEAAERRTKKNPLAAPKSPAAGDLWRGTSLLLVGHDPGEGDAGVIVDAHVHVLPADTRLLLWPVRSPMIRWRSG